MACPQPQTQELTCRQVGRGRRQGGKKLLTRLVPIVLVVSHVPDMPLGLTADGMECRGDADSHARAVFAVTTSVLIRLLNPSDLATAASCLRSPGNGRTLTLIGGFIPM
jgi:hypothetical protein